MLRVVLDTNGLVASLGASSPYRDLWLGFHESKYTLCVSTEILLEYQEIIASKTSSRIADLVIELILNSENVEMVTPYYRWNLIQADHDDNKFVDCAIAANATFIVSDDKHFRPLQFVDFPQVSVLKIMEFIEVLRSSKE
ncbi:MAG: putative toxin-antitoxin system toxin component, PIN family [Prevotella sp.]|nr:putative toxin-antitoxin system toxin component, PIN family [Prevotella sp.]